MKVYILAEYQYDESAIFGVFATLPLAEAARSHYPADNTFVMYAIDEWEVET